MEHVFEKAYAKINLYLDIVSKRSDGYHDIISIMQNISLCDDVKIRKLSEQGIIIKTGNAELDKTPTKNFAYRAAELFFAEIKENVGIEIEITKNIPMGAGMAGGSSDAAATLRGLNKMFEYPLTTDKLCDIGKKIGADVPFCIVGGTQITEGIGEKLAPCNGLKDCFIVVSIGEGSAVSTPVAYKTLDYKFDDFCDYESGRDFTELVHFLDNNDLRSATKCMSNIFEPVICEENNSVENIKNIMYKSGAIFSMMSGSGPSVFGIFESERDAQSAVDKLKSTNCFAGVYTPIINSLI